MSDTVEARVLEMRNVALICDTKGTDAAGFETFVTDLGAELLVDFFAAGASLRAGEIADELPALARLLRNRADRAEAADRGGDTTGFDHDVRWIADALQLGLSDGVGASGSDADLAAHFGRLNHMAEADAGGTYSQEYRGGFLINDSDAAAAGRQLVETLLLTTADGSLVAEDEFQIVSVNGGESFILVLPGVTDLSKPDLGLNDEHRSVRDLDQYALPSAASTSIADNVYAQMVSQALQEANIPAGADIAIVGHSFGADTALDLASDEAFNGGRQGYNVTHVVAAGYHSGPQLEHVPDSTEVLVLQNHHDLAVIGEIAGHAPNQAIEEAKDLDVPGVLDRLGDGIWDGVWGLGDAVVDTGQFAAGSAVNIGSDIINHETRKFGFEDPVGKVDWGDFDDIFLIEDGVTRPTDQQTVVVFEGDWNGFGHHPDNYADHVATTTDQATIDFYESLASEGYTGTMDRWSIDVSVPR